MVYGHWIFSHPQTVMSLDDLLVPTDACLTIGTNNLDEGVA